MKMFYACTHCHATPRQPIHSETPRATHKKSQEGVLIRCGDGVVVVVVVVAVMVVVVVVVVMVVVVVAVVCVCGLLATSATRVYSTYQSTSLAPTPQAIDHWYSAYRRTVVQCTVYVYRVPCTVYRKFGMRRSAFYCVLQQET